METNLVINAEENLPFVVRKKIGPEKPRHLHFHQNYEIGFIIKGGNRFMVDGRFYPALDYDLFLIDKNVIHTGYGLPDQSVEAYVVKFLGQLVSPFTQFTDLLSVFRRSGITMPPKINVPPERREWFIRQFEKLRNPGEYESMSKQVIYLSELLIAIGELTQTESKRTSGNPYTNILNNLITYIEDNLSDPLELEGLAKIAGMSKFHLSRMFKQEFGTSIYQYILTKRINRAVILLEADLSITEICDQTGFGSYPNFITRFKQMKGLPPLQYKNKLIKKDN